MFFSATVLDARTGGEGTMLVRGEGANLVGCLGESTSSLPPTLPLSIIHFFTL